MPVKPATIRPRGVQSPTTGTVAADLRAQGDTFGLGMRRPVRDVQEQTVQGAGHQLHIQAPLPRAGILVAGPVEARTPPGFGPLLIPPKRMSAKHARRGPGLG